MTWDLFPLLDLSASFSALLINVAPIMFSLILSQHKLFQERATRMFYFREINLCVFSVESEPHRFCCFSLLFICIYLNIL